MVYNWRHKTLSVCVRLELTIALLERWDMQTRKIFLLSITILMLSLGIVTAQDDQSLWTMDKVMTPQELKDTGVSGLSPSQRKALDAWLNRFTTRLVKVATRKITKQSTPSTDGTRNDCVSTVESTITSDFNGWDGETIFKLDNGQIWQQTEYDYSYSYAYRPEVTIYPVSGGCRMKVEDEDETILVRRIK
jgi:hypothetical protein